MIINSDKGLREIKYLFIDGACLRSTLAKMGAAYAQGAPLKVDYAKLTAEFSKVFYYDALPGRQRDETSPDYEIRIEPDRRALDELSSLDRFHVYEGDVRRSVA